MIYTHIYRKPKKRPKEGGFTNILNLGSCNIDYVYSVNHIVTPGETEKANGLSLFPGGKGLNQSVALKRAGANVFHAGLIGEDGLFLKELLNKNGVDTSFLTICEEKTGQAIIQVDESGENSIILYPGANEKITPDYIDGVLKHFTKGDVLILQNEISCISYAVDAACKKGLKVILNPSPFNERLSAVDYKKLYMLILNKTEALYLTGEAEPLKIREHITAEYPALHTVLTLGKSGSAYFCGNEYRFMNSFNVNAADTTGAGDTFTGFFVSKFLKTGDCEKSLALATAAAAIAVTRKGAASSIPAYFEAASFLKQQNLPN